MESGIRKRKWSTESERRFQAIDLKKNVSNDSKITKQI